MIDVEDYLLAKFPGKRFNAAGNLHANCPFHDDSTKSFSITRNGMFICGSTKCGLRGNFAYFYKLSENVTWAQVQGDLKVVAPRDNLNIAQLFSRDADVPDDVVNAWPTNVEAIESLEYFEHRGFSPQEITDVCATYGLGYGVGGYHEGVDIEGTIVCPVYDTQGTYRTFQVRYLDADKWQRWKNPLNSPLQDLLYGGWRIPLGEKQVWIVEGASDVWNLSRFGFSAVAVFTKEATFAQMKTLYEMGTHMGLHYLVCLDGDAHSQHKAFGKDYCAKLNSELVAYGLSSSIIYLDAQEDPGGLTEQRTIQLYTEAMR